MCRFLRRERLYPDTTLVHAHSPEQPVCVPHL
jgi:hypothetical protein